MAGGVTVHFSQLDSVIETYEVRASPTYFLIDSDSVVVAVWEGRVEVEELLFWVSKFEAEGPN